MMLLKVYCEIHMGFKVKILLFSLKYKTNLEIFIQSSESGLFSQLVESEELSIPGNVLESLCLPP